MQRLLKNAYILKKEVPELSSANLINYLQYGGWKIIYSNLVGGQKMFKSLKLVERANTNPAFAVITCQLQMVVLNNDLPENKKCSLLIHEIGHILLRHNISDLSDGEEREADKFTTICQLIYRLWDYRWWILAVGVAVILLTISGSFSALPPNCEHCLHHK